MSQKFLINVRNTSILMGSLWALTAGAEPLLAEQPILVHFNVRPPFMIKHADGTITGISATPAVAAFDRAKIAYKLEEASPARQIKDLKDNEKQVCSIGWYKTAEREHFAKFTLPIS